MKFASSFRLRPTTKGEWRISLVGALGYEQDPFRCHYTSRSWEDVWDERWYRKEGIKANINYAQYYIWDGGEKKCYHAVKSALASYWTLGCKSEIPPVLQPSFREMMKINGIHRCFLRQANTNNQWNDAVNIWRNYDRMSLLIRMLWLGINRYCFRVHVKNVELRHYTWGVIKILIAL